MLFRDHALLRFDNREMTTTNCHIRAALSRSAGLPLRRTGLGETDEIEVSERRHRAALRHAHVAMARDPPTVALERELGAPAELAHDRLQHVLDVAAQAGFGTDPGHDDDLA